MEWMCEWCGAPHEADDPPCEHCGHGRFEKAYVRRAAGGVATGPTTQWVCEACGRAHPKHSPPCSRCGHMSLEQRDVDVDPDDLSTPSYLELASPTQLAILAAVLLAAAFLFVGLLGDAIAASYAWSLVASFPHAARLAFGLNDAEC